jgi:hypothetical protein
MMKPEDMKIWRKLTAEEAAGPLPWPVRPGYEVYWFSTSEESWRHLAGRSGMALVRDGKIVDTYISIMN